MMDAMHSARTPMRILIGSGIVLIGGIVSAGAALVYDGFNYTAGADLAGQSPNGGTTSWVATGTGGAGGSDPIVIASGGLTVPGLASSAGNSITFGGLGLTDRLSIGGAITSGTVYYSFAFRVDDVTGLTATGGFFAGFNNATVTQANQPTVIGTRVLTKLNGSGYNIGISKNSSASADFSFDPTVYNVGATIFVVGSYTFNTGTTLDDLAQLWINPDSSTFGSASAPPADLVAITGAAAGNPDLGSIASFLFRQGNATAVPPVVIADELRVDTTWAGVTPVPEPSAGATALLAGGVLFSRRRRRS